MTVYANMTPAQRKVNNRRSAENAIRRNRAMILEAKSGPCVDCGIDWLPSSVMHMDHVRGVKRFNVCAGTSLRVSRKALEAEIAKCELRCPNCHAIRHFVERVNAA